MNNELNLYCKFGNFLITKKYDQNENYVTLKEGAIDFVTRRCIFPGINRRVEANAMYHRNVQVNYNIYLYYSYLLSFHLQKCMHPFPLTIKHGVILGFLGHRLESVEPLKKNSGCCKSLMSCM